jgi:hypothetical protein
MSGNDLVRLWKDPDERGDAAHPAGDITLDDLHGGISGPTDQSFWWAWPPCGNNTFWFVCDPDPLPPLL